LARETLFKGGGVVGWWLESNIGGWSYRLTKLTTTRNMVESQQLKSAIYKWLYGMIGSIEIGIVWGSLL
jgi:hypothetical protein